MDEVSGSTMHDAVGGHHGRLKDVALGRPGWKGRAFGFNGTSSQVVVPDSRGLDPGSRSFAVTVHIRLSQLPETDSYDVIRKGIKGGQYWKLEIHPNGRPHCLFAGSRGAVSTGGREAASTVPSVSDGSWHTVTCQKRSGSVAVTIDGLTFASKGSAGSVRSTDPLTVGFRLVSTSDDFYKGDIDEVHIAKA